VSKSGEEPVAANGECAEELRNELRSAYERAGGVEERNSGAHMKEPEEADDEADGALII
jgi:hypothetical protein